MRARFLGQCLASALSLQYNQVFLPQRKVAYLQPKLVHVHCEGKEVSLGMLERKLIFPNNNPRLKNRLSEVFKFAKWGETCHGIQIADIQGWDTTTNPQYVYMIDAQLQSFCQSIAQVHDLLNFVNSVLVLCNASESPHDLRHQLTAQIRNTPYARQIENDVFPRPFHVSAATARAMYLQFSARGSPEECKCILSDQVSLINLFDQTQTYGALTLGGVASHRLNSIVSKYSFLDGPPPTPPLSSDESDIETHSKRLRKVGKMRIKKDKAWARSVQNAPADLDHILRQVSAVLINALGTSGSSR